MAGPRDGAEAAARCFRGAIGFYRHDDRNGVLTMIAESLEDLPGAAVLHFARAGLLCTLGKHAEAAEAGRAVSLDAGLAGQKRASLPPMAWEFCAHGQTISSGTL